MKSKSQTLKEKKIEKKDEIIDEVMKMKGTSAHVNESYLFGVREKGSAKNRSE